MTSASYKVAHSISQQRVGAKLSDGKGCVCRDGERQDGMLKELVMIPKGIFLPGSSVALPSWAEEGLLCFPTVFSAPVALPAHPFLQCLTSLRN